MRFKQVVIGIAVLLCCFCWIRPAEAQVAPNASLIQFDRTEAVAPYEGVTVTVGLRSASGLPLGVPPSGKLYIWATENDIPSPHLEVLPRSVPEGVYVHGTEEPGVLIMDTGSLIEDQSFRVQFRAGGAYTLHAVFLESGGFQVAQAADYWPYLLTGGSAAQRQMVVLPTPGRDVGYMVVSPQVDGLKLPSQLVYGDHQLLYEGVRVPVHQDGSTTTRIDVAMTRSNGLTVGAGVTVQAAVSASGVALSNLQGVTDANGVASFHINGSVQSGDTIRFSVPGGNSVTMPLYSYQYQPHTVRVGIGSQMMDVDGREVPMDTKAVVLNGRTYLPYRAIGEILGAQIDFNPNIRTITTRIDNKIITMTIGYDRYAVDGVVNVMDAVPYINTDSRTMVPIRFVAEATGYDIEALSDANGLTVAVQVSKRG